jgi:hypothetical protein
MVDRRRVEHRAWSWSGRRHRQGAGVSSQEGDGSGEGHKVGEESHEEADSVNQFFPYAVDMKFAPMWFSFGVRPSKDGVTITDDGFVKATFGFLRLETPLDNVTGAHITTGYRWWTAVGARTSFADDGLTFGTNTKAGLCVHFQEKVRSALSRKGHSAITVTVADLDGLLQAVGADESHP